MKLLTTTLTLLMLFTMAPAGEKNPFFAMDTIARGQPEVVVPMLRELGYAGLGGAPGDAAMARALTAAGLRYFNGYHTITLDASRPALDEPMRKMIEAMPGSAPSGPPPPAGPGQWYPSQKTGSFPPRAPS
jgi:hypothetical protein